MFLNDCMILGRVCHKAGGWSEVSQSLNWVGDFSESQLASLPVDTVRIPNMSR